MKKAKVYNISKNISIAEDVIMADRFISRLKGLLGKKKVGQEEGAVIIPCNSVHSIGMKCSIDVFFLTSENKICHIIHSMKPMRVSPVIKNARYIIELAAGMAEKKNIEIGDEIEVRL